MNLYILFAFHVARVWSNSWYEAFPYHMVCSGTLNATELASFPYHMVCSGTLNATELAIFPNNIPAFVTHYMHGHDFKSTT